MMKKEDILREIEELEVRQNELVDCGCYHCYEYDCNDAELELLYIKLESFK